VRNISQAPDKSNEDNSASQSNGTSNQLAQQYNSLANQNARDLAKITQLNSTAGDDGFTLGRAGFGGTGLASGAAYANGAVARQETFGASANLNPLGVINTQSKRPSKEETV
jgi:hypothetical protein